MMFEAVALFMGERGRDGGKGVERREPPRELGAGNKLWCLWKHRPGRSVMGTLFPPRPPPAPAPAHPPPEKL